jgi:hypothetical protein
MPTAQEADPRVVVAAPEQSVPLVPRAPEARMVPAGTEARGASPQARLVMARSG